MTYCRFSRWRNSAILDFRGTIMGTLKSPCATSYRLSIDTIAVNCLVFEKIAFFCILATDRQTNRWTAAMHQAAFAVASGGLITHDSTCIQQICQEITLWRGPLSSSLHGVAIKRGRAALTVSWSMQSSSLYRFSA